MVGHTDAAVSAGTMTVRDSIVRENLQAREKHTSRAGRKNFVVLTRKQYSSKYLLDAILGGISFLIFIVLYPVVALGIKLSSKGPVIFKQQRTGRSGHTFTCYKFRTMHQLSLRRIDGKPVITQKGDKRIFWFGKLLRRSSLDELPQIINVIKGDMSLIGPRPYPVDECAHWNSKFEDFYYRYAVKPGISGLAQAKGFRGGTLDEDHMRHRLDYDLIYVEKQSLGFDFYIIWHTILQMLKLETNAH
jgi:lipopolysaccharide/colanic/teichoic acid biosynthesis glycosyltransferase